MALANPRDLGAGGVGGILVASLARSAVNSWGRRDSTAYLDAAAGACDCPPLLSWYSVLDFLFKEFEEHGSALLTLATLLLGLLAWLRGGFRVELTLRPTGAAVPHPPQGPARVLAYSRSHG